MALMSLRSRSRVKVSVVLMKDKLFSNTKLYKINSKYYYKTYFIGADGDRTRVLLPVWHIKALPH